MGDNLFRLPDRERQLLLRHCDFYLALATGARQPTTEAQRHFVAVCQGQVQASTEHERAYLDFKKLVSLSRMTARQVIESGFSLEVVVSHKSSKPKPPKSSTTAGPVSLLIGEWSQIDEFGEGVPRPGWFSDDGWRRMRSGYRFDSRD